ncbi:MAG: hypothetical protein UHE62_06295 [Muribaculaceae bacterium]|jgi:hypothetical protein|nr:hypothetical protein [Muribaculaceae bacterium]
METEIVQESYNLASWLIPILTAAIGALIGTFGGAWFLYRRQEDKIENVRLIAIKALKIFLEYAKQKQSFVEASSEFNTKINVSEKRAIVVALHKLGVPFEPPTNDILNIKRLNFKDVVIDKDEIKTMISQINKGNCDNHFYTDIESYFTSNLRLNAVRNAGKKYVKEVLANSCIDKSNSNVIINPDDWSKRLTPGELQTILVLRHQLANTDYFLTNGNADLEKIKILIREIEIGLWDNYLFYDYDAFMNIRAQSSLANAVQNIISNNQPVNINQ